MISVLLCCVVLCIVLWNSYSRKRENLPPLAGGALPIVGHAWLGFVSRERLYEAAVDILEPAAKRNEDMAYLQIGTCKVYVCMDPDDAYLVMNSCLKKDAFYKFSGPLVGGEHGLLNADVSTWKKNRKLLNPFFSQSILDSYLTVINAQSRRLVQLLEQEVDKGYFDQLPYVTQTVLQITRETVLGGIVDNDETIIQGIGKAAKILASCMSERMRKFYYHYDFVFNFSNLKKIEDATAKIIPSFTKKAIRNKTEKISTQEDKEADMSAPGFKSFLDLILEIGKDGVLTETEILQEVTALFVGGSTTTYHALGTMLLTIGSYPEVQQKIFEELQAVGGSSADVDRQDLSKLKYLEAVIKETMRLYPVVFAIGRHVDRNIKLKKYTLPADSRCYLSIYHLGRHRVWGADAAQFRPERWLDGSLPADSRAFAVFALGRRSCIGTTLAMMLMKTVLSHVVRHYRISGDVTRLVQNLDIIVTPASGHHISIEVRNK